MIVLIARGLYLRCEKVHSIAVLENAQYDEYEGSYHVKSAESIFNINIMYDHVKDPNSPNVHHNQSNVCINTYSRKEARDLVHDLINQVREQDPDNKMMDKLIEKHFCGEIENDRRTEKVRRPRKKKTRSKKVLRRP